ncbi:unannotated protein [freshwater metagenome]|uniref:Unannotated protein n=1 Tax=freshwater metagenome TaxID=449393 RepID=A0A6J6T5X4_9ZZZZ
MVRRGDVRRAKLYYLRELRGKASKIKERRGVGGEFIVEEVIAAPAKPVEVAPVAAQVEEVIEAPVIEAPVVETVEVVEAAVETTPEA